MTKMWKTLKVKNYNLNVTEIRDSDFKNAFPGIFNFTVGILLSVTLFKDLCNRLPVISYDQLVSLDLKRFYGDFNSRYSVHRWFLSLFKNSYLAIYKNYWWLQSPYRVPYQIKFRTKNPYHVPYRSNPYRLYGRPCSWSLKTIEFLLF